MKRSKRRPRSQPYKTGYKRPPRDAQFKPGQSGNPKGRPKGSRRLVDDLQRELARLITIDESNPTKKLRIREVITKQLVRVAAKGDLKGIAMIWKALENDTAEPGAAKESDAAFRPEDELVISDIVRRIRLMDEPAAIAPVRSGESG